MYLGNIIFKMEIPPTRDFAKYILGHHLLAQLAAPENTSTDSQAICSLSWHLARKRDDI